MSDTTQPRIPIKIVARRSTSGKHLYDVDGFLLQAHNGKPLNIYTDELLPAFNNGSIRLLRCMSGDYRYFVHHQDQMDRFLEHRELGSPEYSRTYYIYIDEDFTPDSFPPGVIIVYE